MAEKNAAGLYEQEVDGSVYEFEKWDADTALDVLLDIVPLVGGPLGAALGSIATGEGLDTELNPQMIGLIFEALTKNFSKSAVKPLIIKLSSEKVFSDGKKIVFKTYYQDRLMHMFKVVHAALEVQYANFFEELFALVGTKSPTGITNQRPQT